MVVDQAVVRSEFIPLENALDPVYASKLGVDVDNLLLSQPDCGEQALEIAGALISSGAIDVVVVDSVLPWYPSRNWRARWVT